MGDNKKNDGGPAFPVPGVFDYAGMSLREYYAGLAMQGLMTAARHSLTAIAEESVRVADALIAELKK